jgi:hypothetical protein
VQAFVGREDRTGTDFVRIERPGAPTSLHFVPRSRDQFAWLRLAGRARVMADSLDLWFGPCACSDVWVVDAVGAAAGNTSQPGAIFLSRPAVPFTRVQERELCRLLARQWFPSSLDDSAAWLALGLDAYATSRCLESAYGSTNLLDMPFRLFLFSGLGEDYCERVLYYVAGSNGLLKPLESAPDKADTSFLGTETRFAQAGRFFAMLERQMGTETFLSAVRHYRKNRGGAEPSARTFISACSDAADRDMSWLFDRWLPATGTCDYGVKGVRRKGSEVEVGIEQSGTIPMPVEVELRFRDGTSDRMTWVPESAGRRSSFAVATPKRLARVVLDPDRKLSELNRWNNYWPRLVEIRPVAALPSLEAYQLFYGPYAWYDNYHGVQLGAWVQGREFFAAGPLRGRHMWTLSETYSTKIDDWHTGASYITPLDFVSDRLRVSFLGDYSRVTAGARLSLLQELGRPFKTPSGLIDFGYRFFDLYNLKSRDTVAWDSARTGEIRVRFLHSWAAGSLSGAQSIYLGRGLPALGSDSSYRYWKMSIEENCAIKLARRLRLNLRLFAGAIPGNIPDQDQFYLSGGLVPNSAEPISWGYEGMSSAQEHWHYDADVNCRGFAGLYRHGHYAYGANLHLSALPLLAPFFDLGNVGSSLDEPGFRQPRMDAGISLKLGPLYADFPFWRYSGAAGHEFAFRWMLGLKLGAGPGA